MPTLHIFNPDTDYALAADIEHYMPPAHVINVRRENALIPANYASPGDMIILTDSYSPQEIERLRYYNLCQAKGLQILTFDDLLQSDYNLETFNIEPWGWNKQIRSKIYRYITNNSSIPSIDTLEKWRVLSHRRTTIAFLNLMNLSRSEIILPQEISNVDDAMALYSENRAIYFKAPWSSSGRGIMLCDDLEPHHVEPWVRGIINRQRSVMAEKAYPRILDFATEWICEKGDAKYIGLSVFKTSRRGKYHANIDGTQDELYKIISEKTNQNLNEIINRQKVAINQIISPYYNGPLGIDMLVTESGTIHPCVEINLRHTMGMLHLLNNKI